MNVAPILQMRNTNMERGQVTHPRSKSHMWTQEVCIQGWLHTTPCSPLSPLCLHDIASLPTSRTFGEGERGLQITKQDSIDGNEVGWRKHKGGCEWIMRTKSAYVIYGSRWEKTVAMDPLGFAGGTLNSGVHPSLDRWGKLRLRQETEDKGGKGAQIP